MNICTEVAYFRTPSVCAATEHLLYVLLAYIDLHIHIYIYT